MENLLVEMGGMVAAIWAVSEVVGRTLTKVMGREVDKSIVAFVLGPVAGIVAYINGWIILTSQGWQGYATAAFMGFVATVAASVAHDKLVKPVTKKGKKLFKE